jgi:hypothetical protein
MLASTRARPVIQAVPVVLAALRMGKKNLADLHTTYSKILIIQ